MQRMDISIECGIYQLTLIPKLGLGMFGPVVLSRIYPRLYDIMTCVFKDLTVYDLYNLSVLFYPDAF